jgi:hypothetical protein
VLFGGVLLAWIPGLYYDRFSDEITTTLDKIWALSFLAFPLVGVFLARRMPSNPVGWLFLIGPALVGAGVSISEYGEAVELDLVRLSDSALMIGLAAMLSSIVVFPDGGYLNRWYRRAHLTDLAVLGLGIFSGTGVTGFAIGFMFLLAIAALIHRALRGDAAVRRQIAGPVFVAIVGLVLVALLAAKDVLTAPNDSEVDTIIATVTSIVLTVGLPVSIAVAITRYRLYEIDRIISRTVGYLLVVALLGGLFFAAVTTLGSVFPADSPLAVAGSTLAVAALFNPLRRRVQEWVDRRFNRARYDAQRVMERFAGSLQGRLDHDGVVDGWVGVVAETMQPASVAVWVREE